MKRQTDLAGTAAVYLVFEREIWAAASLLIDRLGSLTQEFIERIENVTGPIGEISIDTDESIEVDNESEK